MELPVNEIVFQQDTVERKYWFKAASFAHPAKMVLGLQFYLIEHYTKPGDTILDPMTGSGTVLVACAIGRNVICVELEEKFVKMQQANWEKIQRLGPMLGYTMGSAQIIQGDARNLDGVLADCAIFSPPYAENTHHSDDPKDIEKYRPNRTSRLAGTAGQSKNNIGNLPYGSISAVISSPPYAESQIGDNRKTFNPTIQGITKEGKQRGGSLKSKFESKVDVVCTSPPYKESNVTGKANSYSGSCGPHSQVQIPDYRHSTDNIGNLKSDSYLEAMLLVYQGCYKVLKPEGLLILVTKNFIRDKKIVRLDSDTIKLCEQAGFTLKERLKRKLTQQSFWRRIYMQKFPDAPKIDFEDVLVFSRA